MVKLKNAGRSIRVVHDVKGRPVSVEPGAEKIVNLDDGTKSLIVKMGTLEVIELDEAPKNTVDEDAEIEALRKDAADLGIEVDGRWKAKRLQQEIDDALRSADSSTVQS